MSVVGRGIMQLRSSESAATIVPEKKEAGTSGSKPSDEHASGVKSAESKTSLEHHLKDIDGGYGWVIVLATFILTFSTWGLNSAFGVYFSYYLNSNHFKGATAIDYAAVGGISFGLGLFFSPIINYIQGRIGTRPTILVGNCFQFCGLILASFATNKWQLYLTQGVLQSFGIAFISLPAMTLTPQWFVKKRVLANLITVTGSGVGGIVFNLGLEKIISVKNVHWALRAQAIITVVLVLIAVLLIRTKSKHHKVEFTLYDVDVIQCSGFWMISFYLITVMFGYVVVMYSLNDFTVSLGNTPSQAAVVGTMLQLGFCIGRPFAGFLSDYIGPLTVTAGGYYLATIFTLGMWYPAKNYSTTLALGLFEGIFIGTIFPTCAPIVARLTGISKMNVSFCMLWTFCGLAAIFSQLIGSSLTSGKGSTQYQHTAIFSGVSFFAAATTILVLRGYVIARDKIILSIEKETSEEFDVNRLVYVTVPPLDVFKHCFSWTKKRA